MNDYYVVPTLEAEATLLNAINVGSGMFPLKGRIQRTGELNNNPSSMTQVWATEGKEMLTGERAIDRIPEASLDAANYPQEGRDAFLALLTSLGGEIRSLDKSAFPAPVEDTEY